MKLSIAAALKKKKAIMMEINPKKVNVVSGKLKIKGYIVNNDNGRRCTISKIT